MSMASTADLKSLALNAAREIAGVDAIGDVDVVESAFVTERSPDDRDAYQVTYLYHPSRSALRPGAARSKIGLRLADELYQVGAAVSRLIMLDQTDWDRRRRD